MAAVLDIHLALRPQPLDIVRVGDTASPHFTPHKKRDSLFPVDDEFPLPDFDLLIAKLNAAWPPSTTASTTALTPAPKPAPAPAVAAFPLPFRADSPDPCSPSTNSPNHSVLEIRRRRSAVTGLQAQTFPNDLKLKSSFMTRVTTVIAPLSPPPPSLPNKSATFPQTKKVEINSKPSSLCSSALGKELPEHPPSKNQIVSNSARGNLISKNSSSPFLDKTLPERPSNEIVPAAHLNKDLPMGLLGRKLKELPKRPFSKALPAPPSERDALTALVTRNESNEHESSDDAPSSFVVHRVTTTRSDYVSPGEDSHPPLLADLRRAAQTEVTGKGSSMDTIRLCRPTMTTVTIPDDFVLSRDTSATPLSLPPLPVHKTENEPQTIDTPISTPKHEGDSPRSATTIRPSYHIPTRTPTRTAALLLQSAQASLLKATTPAPYQALMSIPSHSAYPPAQASARPSPAQILLLPPRPSSQPPPTYAMYLTDTTSPQFNPAVPTLQPSHFQCYQSHRSMPSLPNKYHPIACMTCHISHDRGQEGEPAPRLKCTWCNLRVCLGCFEKLHETRGSGRGRDLVGLMEWLERREGKRRGGSA